MVSKHKVLQNWVSEFLDDNYLYFESADVYPNVRVIVPNYGDFVNYTDICGFQYKSYTFIFIAYETIDPGTNDINVTNMELMDSFNEWLVEQQENKNFPDFGDKCSEYTIVPLQNMANLASIADDGLAKYMLGARIDYKEEQ